MGRDTDEIGLSERTLETREIYNGRIVDLRVDTVELPSGRESIREVVVHRGAVAIVPLLERAHVALVRQFRQPTGRVLLEIPAGTLEAGESPEDCAARELAEETGYRAGRLHKLFESFMAPGYSTELLHVFLGEDLALDTGDHPTDSDEAIELVTMPLAQAVEWVLGGRIQDAKTICGVLLAERWLRR